MERASIVTSDLDLANTKISKLWLLLIPVLIVVVAFMLKPRGWQTYNDSQAKFSIDYPRNWKAEISTPTETIENTHFGMVELTGPEGKVIVGFATGFGGGTCAGFAGELVDITTHNQTAQACNRSFEQSEVWIGSCSDCRQIKSDDELTVFDLSAQTNGISPSSRQLILQILSTFKQLR